MTDTQVEYASVILASGQDLLTLLNSILDLAKVESGTVDRRDGRDLAVADLRSEPPARVRAGRARRRASITRRPRPRLPDRLVTDPQRLHQILKNLLANAFKFTEHGRVHVEIGLATSGWSRETESLGRRRSVWPSRSRDTGIGIERGAAAAHLRGVRPGRRHHRPAVRRHRPRAVDQPGAGRPARRRDHAAQHDRARAARSPSTFRADRARGLIGAHPSHGPDVERPVVGAGT